MTVSVILRDPPLKDFFPLPLFINKSINQTAAINLLSDPAWLCFQAALVSDLRGETAHSQPAGGNEREHEPGVHDGKAKIIVFQPF